MEGNKLVGDPLPIRSSMDQVEDLNDPQSIRISEMIARRELELSCVLPSYVKDFLLICGDDLDCRFRWDHFYLHPSNMMLPFEDWNFTDNCALNLPRNWINQHFEKWQRQSLLVIGYLKTMRAYLVIETGTGVLYCFKFNKFTKLLNFTNWYKSFPKTMSSRLQKRIEQYKKKLIIQYPCFIRIKEYRYLPMEMKKDPKLINSTMERGYVESCIPFEYRDNPAFMLKYIRRNVAAFLICSNRLKFDPDFIEKAFELDFSIYYIRDSTNWNKKMKITFDKAVNTIDSFLEKYTQKRDFIQTSKINRKDKELPPPPINGNPVITKIETALTRLKENGLYLTYCTQELASDRNVVLTAVENNGMALEFANEVFREDEEIVRVCLSNNPYSMRLISESFLDRHEDIIIDFMAKNLSNYSFAHLIPAKYCSNFNMMRTAIALNPHNYSITFPPCITSSLSREEILKLRHDKELIIPYIWYNRDHERTAQLMKNLSIDFMDRDITLAVLLSPKTAPVFCYRHGEFRETTSNFILKKKMKFNDIADVKRRFITNVICNTVVISTMNSSCRQLAKFHLDYYYV